MSFEVDAPEQTVETIRANGCSDIGTPVRAPRQPLIVAFAHDIEGNDFSHEGERLGVERRRLPRISPSHGCPA
ncbi:MAG: hypothetical protein GWP04_09150 [Gammaproteobacteria bacterium]|nr:hypothetical protein [Gammaproteobacteria bacterium]